MGARAWPLLIALGLAPLAACDSPCLSVCGDVTPRSEAPVCGPAPACELAPDWGVVDGTRLRSRWYVDEEGTSFFAGMHDRDTGDDCLFASLGDGVRCIPPPVVGGDGMNNARYFADADCRRPLLTAAQAAAPHTVLGVGDQFYAPDRAFAPGARVTVSQVFHGWWWLEPQGGGGGAIQHFECEAVPVPASGLHQAIEVAPSIFVGASQVVGDAGVRLRPTVWAADDGARVPIAVNGFGQYPWWGAETRPHDVARNAPCERVHDRCLPWPAERHLGTPDCTADGVEPMGLQGSTYALTTCPGTTLPPEISVTAVASVKPCSGGRALVSFDVPSDFPAQRDTFAGAGRLKVPAVSDGEGYCQPSGPRLYDSRHGLSCDVTVTAGGLRCVPAGGELLRIGWLTTMSTDPMCQLPVRVIECHRDDCVLARDVEDDPDAFYLPGAAIAGPLYESSGGGCRRAIRPVFEVGARASLAALTEATHRARDARPRP